MTPGVRLNDWKRIGTLSRELRPYLEYIKRGWNIKILTFDRDEFRELPEGIEIVRFPKRTLLWFLPWTHKKLGEWADLIKTNQSHHAYFYTRAARLWKKPLFLRCGYVHGEYLETTYGLTLKTKFYQLLEAKAFREAVHCQVPTKELADWVKKKYGIDTAQLSVIPNFVDAEIFKPIDGIKKKEKSVISIGRLTPVKRYDLLIRACSSIPGCELTVIGEGPEKMRLQQIARSCGLKLTLPGNILNESLPQFMQEHMVFAITSEREGHPKALIEAMACGMPCLGVKAIGIENIMKHGENGWLAEPDHESVRKGLSTLFEKTDLCSRISRGAREYAFTYYDFDKCFSLEYSTIESILKEKISFGTCYSK